MSEVVEYVHPIFHRDAGEKCLSEIVRKPTTSNRHPAYTKRAMEQKQFYHSNPESALGSGSFPLSAAASASLSASASASADEAPASDSVGMPFSSGHRTSERTRRRKRSASFDYNVGSEDEASDLSGMSNRARRGRPGKQAKAITDAMLQMGRSTAADVLVGRNGLGASSQSVSHHSIPTEYIQNPIYSDLHPSAPGISVRDLPRIPTGSSTATGFTPLAGGLMTSSHLHSSSSNFDLPNIVPFNRGISIMSTADLGNLPLNPLDRGLSFLTGQPTPMPNLYGFPSMPGGGIYRDLSVLTDPGTTTGTNNNSITLASSPSVGMNGNNLQHVTNGNLNDNTNNNNRQAPNLQDEEYKKLAAPFLEFTRTLSVESSKASPDAATRVISNASGEVKVTVPAWIAGGDAAPTRGSPFNKMEIAVSNFDGNISPITPAVVPVRKTE
jgi:hypothetical protein